jgi:hypothetical protein
VAKFVLALCQVARDGTDCRVDFIPVAVFNRDGGFFYFDYQSRIFLYGIFEQKFN